MVRDAGSLVSRQVGVGFACHNDRDALGGERYAKTAGKREGDVFLYEVACDTSTGVGASVSGVDDDGKGWLYGERVCRRSGKRREIRFGECGWRRWDGGRGAEGLLGLGIDRSERP